MLFYVRLQKRHSRKIQRTRIRLSLDHFIRDSATATHVCIACIHLLTPLSLRVRGAHIYRGAAYLSFENEYPTLDGVQGKTVLICF